MHRTHVHQQLTYALTKRSIMFEFPANEYLMYTLAVVQYLMRDGFTGIYVSTQRPFSNIFSFIEKYDIPTDKLFFVDMSGHNNEHPQCVCVKQNIDAIVRAVYTLFDKLDGERKFVFIDSLSTISLYNPLSEILRFSDFLLRLLDTHEDLMLFFNVAKDLSHKKFIQDIALHVDEVVLLEK